MIPCDTVVYRLNISKHAGELDLLLGLATLELLHLHAFAPQQLALLLPQDVEVALAGDLVVGGLPLQRAAPLVALSCEVPRALVLAGPPALVFQLVALVHGIVGALLEGLPLTGFMSLQDMGDWHILL